MTTDDKRSRRDFLRTLAITGAGATLAGCNSAGDTSPALPAPVEALPVADQVPRRKLGATGLEVPILTIGGGQTFDPRYDKILHRAYREGVDFLDTALLYSDGMSHRTLAPFVKQVGRENLIIVSKGHSDRATVSSFSRDLDKCLRQLETDYLDLFFMQAVENPNTSSPSTSAWARRCARAAGPDSSASRPAAATWSSAWRRRPG